MDIILYIAAIATIIGVLFQLLKRFWQKSNSQKPERIGDNVVGDDKKIVAGSIDASKSTKVISEGGKDSSQQYILSVGGNLNININRDNFEDIKGGVIKFIFDELANEFPTIKQKSHEFQEMLETSASATELSDSVHTISGITADISGYDNVDEIEKSIWNGAMDAYIINCPNCSTGNFFKNENCTKCGKPLKEK